MKRLSPHEHVFISFAVHINLSSIFIRQPEKNLIRWFSIMEQKFGINFGCLVACKFFNFWAVWRTCMGSLHKMKPTSQVGLVIALTRWRWWLCNLEMAIWWLSKWTWQSGKMDVECGLSLLSTWTWQNRKGQVGENKKNQLGKIA
jgi:hypothetical protein